MGAAVSRPLTPAVRVSDTSYPLAPEFETFLRWRNRLRIAFAHAPAEQLGEELCAPVVALLSAAWSHAGLDALRVSFGGDWGRTSLTTRLRTQVRRPASGIPVARRRSGHGPPAGRAAGLRA